MESVKHLDDCAWNYPGRVMNTGKPFTWTSSNWTPDGRHWDRPSLNQKFLLLAIAKLQELGVPATPRAVAAQSGLAPSTCARRLRWLSGMISRWYKEHYPDAYYEWSPLTRHKHGRTFRYTLNNPVITKDW